MSARTVAQVAAIDQAHAEAVADLDRFIEDAGEVASMLAVAVLRAAVAEGGARDGE